MFKKGAQKTEEFSFYEARAGADAALKVSILWSISGTYDSVKRVGIEASCVESLPKNIATEPLNRAPSSTCGPWAFLCVYREYSEFNTQGLAERPQKT